MQSNAVRSAQQLASALKVAALGGVGIYGLSNSIFNVEGGHRAVIFNRVVGIKDTVRTGCVVLPDVSLKHPLVRFTLKALT